MVIHDNSCLKTHQERRSVSLFRDHLNLALVQRNYTLCEGYSYIY